MAGIPGAEGVGGSPGGPLSAAGSTIRMDNMPVTEQGQETKELKSTCASQMLMGNGKGKGYGKAGAPPSEEARRAQSQEDKMEVSSRFPPVVPELVFENGASWGKIFWDGSKVSDPTQGRALPPYLPLGGCDGSVFMVACGSFDLDPDAKISQMAPIEEARVDDSSEFFGSSCFPPCHPVLVHPPVGHPHLGGDVSPSGEHFGLGMSQTVHSSRFGLGFDAAIAGEDGGQSSSKVASSPKSTSSSKREVPLSLAYMQELNALPDGKPKPPSRIPVYPSWNYPDDWEGGMLWRDATPQGYFDDLEDREQYFRFLLGKDQEEEFGCLWEKWAPNDDAEPPRGEASEAGTGGESEGLPCSVSPPLSSAFEEGSEAAEHAAAGAGEEAQEGRKGPAQGAGRPGPFP